MPKERSETSGSGLLIVAATPLGNVADASERLRTALASADVIAAEDTRRLFRLARELGVAPSGRVVSHWEAVERARLAPLLEELHAGATVLLVSDAGMPLVSDPGFLLVAAAAAEGIRVTALPGASAVTTALAVSGLPCDRFCFEGFLPRTPSARRRTLAALATEPRTMVLFESTHRVAASLADMAAAFGESRKAVVCRELTKTYEDVRRGTLAELASWAVDGEVRGEITLVVAGAGPTEPDATAVTNAEQVVAELRRRVAAGERRTAVAAELAQRHGLDRRILYEASVAATRSPG